MKLAFPQLHVTLLKIKFIRVQSHDFIKRGCHKGIQDKLTGSIRHEHWLCSKIQHHHQIILKIKDVGTFVYYILIYCFNFPWIHRGSSLLGQLSLLKAKCQLLLQRLIPPMHRVRQ